MKHFYCFDNLTQFRKRLPIIMNILNLDMESRETKRRLGKNNRSNDLSVGTEHLLDLNTKPSFLGIDPKSAIVLWMPHNINYFLSDSLENFNKSRGLL